MPRDPYAEAAAMVSEIARVDAPLEALADAGLRVVRLRLELVGRQLRNLPTAFISVMEDARAGHPEPELAVRLRLLSEDLP